MNSPDLSKSDVMPAIAEDEETPAARILADKTSKAWNETLSSGRSVDFNRSLQKVWRQGEESRHVQEVRSVSLDRDANALLMKVDQIGEAYQSCRFRKVDPECGDVDVVGERVFVPIRVDKM